jgi:hypothetical protein
MIDFGVPSDSTFYPLIFGVIYLQSAILPTPIVLTSANISYSTLVGIIAIRSPCIVL